MLRQTSKSLDPSSAAGHADHRNASAEPTNICADLKVVGDLHSTGAILIKGIVEGDIKSRTVTINEGAQVTGSIFADTVSVSGAVTGQIEASNVTLNKTARVLGDVAHETLTVEAGAHLVGACRRIDAAKPSDSVSVSPLKATQTEPIEAQKRAAGAP